MTAATTPTRRAALGGPDAIRHDCAVVTTSPTATARVRISPGMKGSMKAYTYTDPIAIASPRREERPVGYVRTAWKIGARCTIRSSAPTNATDVMLETMRLPRNHVSPETTSRGPTRLSGRRRHATSPLKAIVHPVTRSSATSVGGMADRERTSAVRPTATMAAAATRSRVVVGRRSSHPRSRDRDALRMPHDERTSRSAARVRLQRHSGEIDRGPDLCEGRVNELGVHASPKAPNGSALPGNPSRDEVGVSPSRTERNPRVSGAARPVYDASAWSSRAWSAAQTRTYASCRSRPAVAITRDLKFV